MGPLPETCLMRSGGASDWMMARPSGSCPVTMRRNSFDMVFPRYSVELPSAGVCSKGFGDTVGNVASSVGHVVDADVLDSPGPLVEDLEFALRTVDQLLVGLPGILERYLPVLRPVSHQERDPHSI